jgi:CHAT domain-containing protein
VHLDAADRATLLRLWPLLAFVHLSGHGTFAADRPSQTGLVLLPRPGRRELLSLRDLSGLATPHLRHVTLANCWQADNYALPGRWALSLPASVCRAGAGSALACLWPIDDAVSGAFFAHFYTSLARGLRRDEALRQAQLACRAGSLGVAGVAHPFFWAGFVLHGEAGPLRF